jgi:DNA repair protein RadC
MKTIRWQMVMEDQGEYPEAPLMKDPEAVARLMNEQGHATADRERFVVYLLNVKHRINAEEVVSIGILDGSLIHPREVFKAAVTGGAAAIIIAHNHPSGDPAPSQEDREVTRRLRDAGKILGIPVLDHVIVSPGGKSFSFREQTDW